VSKTKSFTSIGAALKEIEKDAHKFARGISQSMRKAARSTATEVRQRRVPTAFKELQDSIDVLEGGIPARSIAVGNVDHVQIIASAPHAAAVENGARPHWAPLEPLIAWVKLRGMQGLTRTGKVKSKGGWRLAPARYIAGQLSAMEKNGSLDIDAPVEIARAIQRKIAAKGTKPQPYMGPAVPYLLEQLDTFIKAEAQKA
jgi:hypothetical protein